MGLICGYCIGKSHAVSTFSGAKVKKNFSGCLFYGLKNMFLSIFWGNLYFFLTVTDSYSAGRNIKSRAV